jgi:hypothetical protein
MLQKGAQLMGRTRAGSGRSPPVEALVVGGLAVAVLAAFIVVITLEIQQRTARTPPGEVESFDNLSRKHLYSNLDYEQSTLQGMEPRLTKTEYESLVLRALHRRLIEQDPGLRYDEKIRVEDVRLDTSRPEHMLEILFRDDARPRCVFGWRFPATNIDQADPESMVPWGPEQAEIWANTFVLTNFEEQIQAAGLGLPSECDLDSITWVGDYKP